MIQFVVVVVFSIFYLSGCAVVGNSLGVKTADSKTEKFKKDFFAVWEGGVPDEYPEVLEEMIAIAKKDGFFGENLMPVSAKRVNELELDAKGRLS